MVFLVGFMGCGKSAVGRALARELGSAFFDLDDRIALAAGRSVSAIFEAEGEVGFRARERAALLALEPEFAAGAVIATGGGAFADEAARAWMRAHGETVWLDATLNAIERRVARDGSRPLYGDRATLEALYTERRGAYATAGMRVDTDAHAPSDIARSIARRVRAADRAERE